MKIQRLANSNYFRFDVVFLVFQKGGYRLVVVHQKRVLYDTLYLTEEGAKVAFSKLYDSNMEVMKPWWTHEYEPEGWWFNEILPEGYLENTRPELPIPIQGKSGPAPGRDSQTH